MLIRHDESIVATPDVVADLQRRLAAVGAYHDEPTGELDIATREALADWAGRYNLEGRLRDDDLVSTHLLMELKDVTPEI
jgi:hypothetical protein